ncbi:SDR family oxidoreductase [Roseovarius sp. EL26]|uniref:SDR family NAD(P)-dependent oxidoreductase n=1 Tax=Roseovarius sp. EL26 TaxID=2126672 RepID=UPI0013C3FC55|nr:SDR family oxidoreductase [Roseovarius sp. EL26]
MQNWTLITGASEGLGVEFARLAAAEGRNLILTARSEGKLNTLAQELRNGTIQVEVIPADLADPAQVINLWNLAIEGRQIDVLVNNAGLGRHGQFGNGADWAREQSSIQVNVLALSYLMKQAIPHMQGAGGGKILNVASVAGFMPGPNMAIYHATKAFVLSLSEAVAEEIGSNNVTITALCPGATHTSFFDAADMGGVRLLKLNKPMSATSVAQTGWQAMHRGKRVVVPGLLNKLFAFSPRISPRRLVTLISNTVMGKTH